MRIKIQIEYPLMQIYICDSDMKKMRCAGCIRSMNVSTNTYIILIAKPEIRRPVGRPRHRWGNKIRTDLNEIGWGV
jgi:hypothetical protein